MGYEKLKQTITKLIPSAVMEEVFIEKLGKPLLFVCFEPNIRTLRVYNSNSLNEEVKVAEIRYRIGEDSVYISSFNVDEKYQQMGIGRTIFEFAMAHGDAKGATKVYGTASPTDPIKGVSDEFDESNYEKEVEALKTIYGKLGCVFIDSENFVRKWHHGELFDKIEDWAKSMIGKAISKENVDVM